MIETIEQYQLDLFKDPEICRLEAEIAKTKESNNRVRKKLFAENGKKTKAINELTSRLEIIEAFICQGDYEFKRK